ncbi:MAG: hypothetical protein EOO78_10525, partial [Oxalobacteraceae bacterium]
MAAATATAAGTDTAGPGLAARLAGALPILSKPNLRMPILRKPGPLAWLTLAALLLAAAGAWVIATHARWLAAAALDTVSPQLAVLQPALPGVAFEVPDSAGVLLDRHGAASLLVLSGMRAEPAQRIDLCAQMADPARGRLLPVRIGWHL